MVSIHRHEKYRGFSVAIFARGYPLKLVGSNGKHSSAWLQHQSSSASGNKGRAQGKVAKSNLISDALLGSLPSMQTCCAPDPINSGKKHLCKFVGNFGIFFLKHFGLDHSYTVYENNPNSNVHNMSCIALAFQFKVPQLGIHVIVIAGPLHQPFASTTSGASSRSRQVHHLKMGQFLPI